MYTLMRGGGIGEMRGRKDHEMPHQGSIDTATTNTILHSQIITMRYFAINFMHYLRTHRSRHQYSAEMPHGSQ
jgi:hypothetical protein